MAPHRFDKPRLPVLMRATTELHATININLLPFQVPSTQAQWTTIAQEFMERWNFPNCIGALDGKHIAIQAPAHSGSVFFNYKHFYSIVVMALVDARYRFTMVDVGANGRACDAGIFGRSNMATALENNTVAIPPPRPLPGRVNNVPFVVVADDAFGLKPHIMKPYPGREIGDFERIHNYRLSRARRVSENAFGILAKRFRVLDKRINLSADKCTLIVNACITLHNFLMSQQDRHYTASCEDPAISLTGVTNQAGNRSTDTARQVRDEFADYFISNGQVDWQWDSV